MKKGILIILSVLLALSVFTADGQNGMPEAETTPDDIWDGDYSEYSNRDGSVTYVFDSGSVVTVKADGSKEGFDYLGNQHIKDTEGNYTVKGRDGYTATEMTDGTKSLTDPSGKTTVIRPDGSFSEELQIGVTLDYNADGGIDGIGLNGDSQRLGIDEYGCYKTGSIKTADGRILNITDDGIKIVNDKGTEVNATYSGNSQEVTIDWRDGAHFESTTTTTWNNGQKTEDTEASLKDPDGNLWETNKSLTYDKDGNPSWSGNNVSQFTSADGDRYWVDNNSQAMEYFGKNGNQLIIDHIGNLTSFKDEENDWLVSYDGNGAPVAGKMTFADGSVAVIADGVTTLTKPDGTVYETDRQGNVFKDGVQIKEGGEWIPGMEETESDSPFTDATVTPTNPGRDIDNEYDFEVNAVPRETRSSSSSVNDPERWIFYGTELVKPYRDYNTWTWEVTEWKVKDDATTIRIDGMSYVQFVAYCRSLEIMTGWEACDDEDTNHFPADYNSRSKVYFSGSYGNLPHISVQYYSDETCKKTKLPHFCMFVFKNWH